MNLKTKLVSLSFLLATASFAQAALRSEPGAFDFGWSPENSKIFCEFTIKNTGENAVGLQALKPACGCTAASFSPMSLASADDTKIGLTFNTRGYTGTAFNKSANLETDSADQNIVVYLKGHVTDPAAQVFPVGNGVAAFEPGAKSSQKIVLQNKTGKDLKLSTIYSQASWAKVKLESDTLKAGQTVDVMVNAAGSFDEVRETSITLEGAADDARHRVTLAIRTGAAPKPYQPLRPAASQPDGSPKNADGFNDPLKLKPIEPVKSK